MKIVSLSQTEITAVSHNPKIRKKTLLSNGELGPITNLEQAVFPPGEVAGEHAHADMGEVFMIVSGEGVIMINSEEYPLAAGDCVVVEPNERHEIRNTGMDEMVVTYFGVKL